MRRLTLLLAGVLALALPASTQAVPIPVVNHSFESPAHPLPEWCGTDCSYNFGPIDGWTIDAGGFGLFHPNDAYFNLPLPDGDQTAYSNGGTLSQALSITLQNDTTYELRVEVGRRLDGYWPAGYQVALFAGSTLIGFESSLNPAAGEFETSLVTYASGPLNPLTGQPLRIQLFSSGAQANFDNVRFDASQSGAPVPEPGTLALLGAGLAGLVRRRRRPPAGLAPR